MFKFFKRRKWNRLASDAKRYADAVYTPEHSDVSAKEEPRIRYSLSVSHEDVSRAAEEKKRERPDVMYSLSNEVEDNLQERSNTELSEPRVRYSIKRKPGLADNYDEKAVNSFMQMLNQKSAPDTASLLDSSIDMSFVDKLLQLIQDRQLRDSAVYKAAQIDRRLFSKIVSERSYKPAKDTCIALAFALHLDLEETKDLLSRAGYLLSHSSKRDVILEYFVREHIYNLNDINEVLYRLGQKTLGR